MYLLQQPPGRIAGGEIWFRGLNLLAGSDEDIRVVPRTVGPPKFLPADDLLKQHRARMNRVRGHGMSMIFQEPMSSLNPVLRVGYQVAEVLMFQRRQEICDRLLSRRDLTDADLCLFRQAVASGEASERERLVAGFCVRSEEGGSPRSIRGSSRSCGGAPSGFGLRRVWRDFRNREIRGHHRGCDRTAVSGTRDGPVPDRDRALVPTVALSDRHLDSCPSFGPCSAD